MTAACEPRMGPLMAYHLTGRPRAALPAPAVVTEPAPDPFQVEPAHHRWLLTTCVAGIAGSLVIGSAVLGIFGDSITTDHISPSTKIRPGTPAGKWLEPFQANHPPAEWGHFGVRRCNHELMVRGTFANVRLRNAVAPGTEGPVTKHQPDGAQMTIFEASELYRASGTPLVIFGGEDYGMGSSRDWAAKGVQLLGRDEIGGLGQRGHHGRSLFGAALHSTSLVVVLCALDVNVVIVMFDAVFLVEVFVDFVAKSRQQPSLVDDTVEKRDEESIEDNLPDQL
jgi:hypothetical protein